MGLSDYWKDKTASNLPVISLGSGSYSDDDNNSLEDDPSAVLDVVPTCFDSSDCASGWSCINGVCAQSDPGASGSGGGTSGCGSDGDNNEPCGSTGGSQSCTKSTCGVSGNNPGDGSCCDGQTCCQKQQGGGILCSCGPCPPPNPECDPFCAAHYAAYGKLTLGCTEGNVCTQCEECRLTASYQPRECVPLEPEDASCWCPQSINDPPDDCMKCMAVADWVKDCENCQSCYTIEVNCGCAISTTKCCEPGCITSKGEQNCKTKAWQNCYAACTPPDPADPPSDPCAGECYGQHFCDGPPPPCPEGSSCTDNGTISGGGRTCYIRTVCDKTGVPPECGDCDCNCDNDCKYCEICSEEGLCVDDPECNKEYKSRWRMIEEDYVYYSCNYNPDTGTGGCNEAINHKTNGLDFQTGCGPLPHVLVETDNDYETNRPYGPCTQGGNGKCWRIQDGDGNWISNKHCSAGVVGVFCLGASPVRAPQNYGTEKC